MFTNIRIDKKKLIYIHRIIGKSETTWTRMVLHVLEGLNLGGYKDIQDILTTHNLPTSFTEIKSMTKRQWIRLVNEKTNKRRLYNKCHEIDNWEPIPKTKTATIISHITEESYTRKPLEELTQLTKVQTKAILIARYGMLECRKNCEGTMSATCTMSCIQTDKSLSQI